MTRQEKRAQRKLRESQWKRVQERMRKGEVPFIITVDWSPKEPNHAHAVYWFSTLCDAENADHAVQEMINACADYCHGTYVVHPDRDLGEYVTAGCPGVDRLADD